MKNYLNIPQESNNNSQNSAARITAESLEISRDKNRNLLNVDFLKKLHETREKIYKSIIDL